jgi:hypothetical protein
MPANKPDPQFRRDGPEPVIDGWHVRSGLDFRQIEELLDWLEREGIKNRELKISNDHRYFTLRWRRE